MNALEFADAVGRKKMADALNVGVTAVSNAVVRDRFPATWLETCRALAADMEVDFPLHLFGQKGSYYTKRVSAAAKVQDRTRENLSDGAA